MISRTLQSSRSSANKGHCIFGPRLEDTLERERVAGRDIRVADRNNKPAAYLTSPLGYSTDGSIGMPDEYVDLYMSKVAEIDAMDSHIAAFARYFPGQYRRPKPYTTSSGFGTFGSSCPALVRKRSGLNRSGLA